VISESRILDEKKSLLINSTSLVWVIRNRTNIIASFLQYNRKGPSLIWGRGYAGAFGAVGYSGRKYFFINPDSIDSFVEVPVDISPQEDGIGGPAGGVNWIRFKGERENILNIFIKLHQRQRSLGGDISGLLVFA